MSYDGRLISADSHVVEPADLWITRLDRKFRDHLKRPVASEIRRLRLERTKRQLLESNDPIGAIAHRSGFADTKSLCQVLRREIGMSPREFRKQRESRVGGG